MDKDLWGNGDEYGYSLKKTDDGGFIIGGATSSFGAGQFDFYIVRTDSLGDTLWTRTFGGVNDDICWSMDKTEDGGFVLAGEINAFPQIPDAMIVKLNYLGDLVWEKIYGSNLFDRVFSIKENINGEFLVSGMHQILGVNENGWLLKLNPDGDSLVSILWRSIYR
ncbi:MAG: hypothetical protein IPH11_09840 [Ignavibacteriales bacterium]|nr:hypothetical protein [Ignavibacteriales bacterium]